MVDNSSIPVASGNETFANNDIGGIKYPRVKLVWGASGAANDASAANPIPVSGTVTVNALPTGTNNIGDVDVLTMPAVTVNGIATTAPDRGTGAATAQTLRVVIASEQMEAGEYEDVAASQASTTLGPTGSAGDFLSSITFFPESVNPGAVTLQDGALTAVTVFFGGSASVSNLVPFTVVFGNTSVNGAWKVVTGAAIHIRASGNFT